MRLIAFRHSLLGEAHLNYRLARPIGCVVTLGTGMNPNIALPDTSSIALGKSVAPDLFERWFGSYERTIEKYTPENWAQVTIALDDYKAMDHFGMLTQEYMKTEVDKAQTAAAKLPPRRFPLSTVKQ